LAGRRRCGIRIWAAAAFSVTAVPMITHRGYRLPVYDWLFATALGHHLHHASRKPTNVSVVLTICDRLFGTFQRVSLPLDPRLPRNSTATTA
jgi:sterol desaturase/sphingolipid hydroxylase (fatty acid hydroxylase superfamily)